jgi:sugar lactone lactonase YvrE
MTTSQIQIGTKIERIASDYTNGRTDSPVVDEQSRRMIGALRSKGFAVVVFTPEELEGAEHKRVEERLIELGRDVIQDLK